MIILEGPDNSGKSTLAKLLRSRLGLKVEHTPRVEGELETAIRHRQQIHFDGVLDRIQCISEVVYSKVFGRKNFSTYSQLMDVKQFQHVIIYCRPDNKTVLANDGRPQMDGVVEMHKQLIQAYDGHMHDLQQAGFNVVHYDWRNPASIDHTLKAISTHLAQQKHLELLEKICY